MSVEQLGVLAAANVAFARVRAMVERPTRVRRGLGLAGLGLLARVGVWATPLLLLCTLALLPAVRAQRWAWGLAGGGVVVAMGLLYLGSRLQLMLFELLLRAPQRPGSAWGRVGDAVWPWMGAQMLVLLPAGVLLVGVVAVPMHHLFGAIWGAAAPPAGAQPNPALPLIVFATEIVGFVAFGCLLLLHSLLTDFALPFVAVDGSSAWDALRRAVALVRAHTRSVLGYLGFAMLLALGGAMAQNMVGFVVALCVGAVLGAAGLVMWLALHAVVSQAVVYVGAALLYASCILAAAAVGMVLIGAAAVYLEAYAMCFVGSRHEAMGQEMGLTVRVPPPPLGAAEAPAG